MEALLTYLVKSAALMGVFYIAYALLLRRETFFRSNRWYLLSGLVTSLVLPLVTFEKVVWVEPVKPVVNWNTVSLSEVDTASLATMAPQPDPVQIDWMLVSVFLYMAVVMLLLLGFARDCYALRKLLKGRKIRRQLDYKLVDVNENVAPFSYFSYIVYNSSLYSREELANILEHEKVHSEQQHTFDVLLSRMVCIAFWWNPFAWLYKKAVVQNLEFIADSEALKRVPDVKSYQITLLKITTHESCVSITNHFFQSLIKKRIVMLNKNQSNKWNSWKYLLVLPALAAFLICFQVRVIAQEKFEDAVLFTPQQGIEVVVDKNTSDAQLKQHAETLKREHGIKLKFSKVKRNANGEIVAIKADFRDPSGKKGTTHIKGDKPIEPIFFYKGDGSVGFRNADPYRGYHPGEHIYTFSRNNNDGVQVYEMPEMPEMPEFSEIPEFDFRFDVDSLVNAHKIVISSRDGEKETVTVNGRVVTGEEAEKALASADAVKIKSYTRRKNGSDDVIVNVNGENVFNSADVKVITDKAMVEARKAMAASRPEIERAKIAAIRANAQANRVKDRVKYQRDAEREFIVKGRHKAEQEQLERDLEATQAEVRQMQEELKKMREELEKERKAKK